ncbi:MAG TPA: hypothetical protein PKD54_14555 [Pirellulaceae bacterium]|nr:hypothetical protein [Pirellulaceae bacterium]
MTVHLKGIIGDETELSRTAPQLVLIGLTRQQAQQIRDYFDSIAALRATARERWDAVEFGSEEEIAAAQAYYKHITALCVDAQRAGLKHKLNEVLDRQQLETLKSLGIDLALQEFGFRQIVYDTLLEMSESNGFQISHEEVNKLLQAILETECELRRDVVRMRREAWDRLMKKLPDGVEEQIEVRLGLDGIGK